MTSTIRLTTAEAIVRYLTVQRTVIDGRDEPLIPGVFAIFGHGNVTCLGPALHDARDDLPTWRGQNEQGMALAAIAYAKAMRRRQLMVATTSIGPGALNLVTAAGVAMANRLPVLLLSGDTFQSRLPDPVLQQVEHFGSPSTTANDAFRAVVRYWDRITRPEQVIQSLPQALADDARPGRLRAGVHRPAPGRPRRGLRLPAAPVRAGRPRDRPAPTGRRPGRRGDRLLLRESQPAADRRRGRGALLARRGGAGVVRRRHGIPVVETVAGKSTLTHDHPCYAGPIGVIGAEGANRLAAEADVVLAVGTRLGDFATGSWSVFQNPDVRFVGINAARFDAHKHRSLPVVGDAREALVELDDGLGDWRAPAEWTARIGTEVATLWEYLDRLAAAERRAADVRPGRPRHR